MGLAQIDVPFESLAPAGDGLLTLPPDAVPGVARKLAEMLERAAARHIELLLFPELSIDAGLRLSRSGGADTTEIRAGLTWSFGVGIPRSDAARRYR